MINSEKQAANTTKPGVGSGCVRGSSWRSCTDGGGLSDQFSPDIASVDEKSHWAVGHGGAFALSIYEVNLRSASYPGVPPVVVPPFVISTN